MSKRLGLLFLVIATAGLLVWWLRQRAEMIVFAAISDRKTSGDPPTAMISESAVKDPEAARESSRHSAGEVERHQAEERRLAELKQAVRDQEEKVEERRKVLATIVRTKGIIYKGPDADYSGNPETPHGSAKIALDAQDYVDAKRDFETAQKLLQELKLQLVSEKVNGENSR